MSEHSDSLHDQPDGVASASDLPDSAPEGRAEAPPSRHPVLVYSALRFAILAGVGALLYLVGLRGLLLLVFAFLISGVISIFALNRTREGAAWGITTAVTNLNDRIDASARAEDDDPDDDLVQYAAEAPPEDATEPVPAADQAGHLDAAPPVDPAPGSTDAR